MLGTDKCWSKHPASPTAQRVKDEQDRRKCLNCGKTGHLEASCQSKNQALAAIADCAVPLQRDVRPLTTLSCDDDSRNSNYMLGCVASGSSVSGVSGTSLL